ncbi:MAG: phosphatidylglycerophosphatase A [Holophaga sp.]
MNPKAPRWAWWVATGFGSGYLKPAPGTWGSLSALLAWLVFTVLIPTPFATWAMRHSGTPRLFLGYGALEVATPFSGLRLGSDHPGLAVGYWAMEALFLTLPILMIWLAVKASDRVVRETGLKDPGFIVADEWAGMWIALWPLRWQLAMNLHRFFSPNVWRCLPLLLIPFLLFRLFDIWKPWPIRQIQVLPEGQGVVADDVVAGIYALMVVQLAMPIILTTLR